LSLRGRRLALLPLALEDDAAPNGLCIECLFIRKSGKDGEANGRSVGDSKSLAEFRLSNGKGLESGLVFFGDVASGVANGEPCVGVCSGGVFGLDSDCFKGAGRSFRLLVEAPVVVLLRTNLGGVSVIVSSGVCGFRAWAIARGPAKRGRIGAAMLPRIKLASKVIGNTFSFNFSRFFCSTPPKTICCTRL
jgi:hypothetical protein